MNGIFNEGFDDSHSHSFSIHVGVKLSGDNKNDYQ